MRESDIRCLQLDLTSYCNLKCPFCSRTKKIKGSSKIEFKHFSTNIIFTKFSRILENLNSISLCGTFGEPTLHPKLIEIIDYFHNNSLAKITTDSNGSTHDESWWYKLGGKNIELRFAIDGVSEETFSKYRIGTSFAKVIQNVSSYVKGGGKAEWHFVVFEHNESEIEQAKTMAKEIGCEIFFRGSRNYNDSLRPPHNFKTSLRQCEKCKFVHKKELYVAYDCQIEFCCRYQPRWADVELCNNIKKLYMCNLDKFSLLNHSINDILQQPYFEYMESNFGNICNKYKIRNK